MRGGGGEDGAEKFGLGDEVVSVQGEDEHLGVRVSQEGLGVVEQRRGWRDVLRPSREAHSPGYRWTLADSPVDPCLLDGRTRRLPDLTPHSHPPVRGESAARTSEEVGSSEQTSPTSDLPSPSVSLFSNGLG